MPTLYTPESKTYAHIVVLRVYNYMIIVLYIYELTKVGSDQRSNTIQYDSKSKHSNSKRRQSVNWTWKVACWFSFSLFFWKSRQLRIRTTACARVRFCFWKASAERFFRCEVVRHARACSRCACLTLARAARDGLAALGVLGGSAAKWTNVVWPIKRRKTNKPTNTHYSFIGIDKKKCAKTPTNPLREGLWNREQTICALPYSEEDRRLTEVRYRLFVGQHVDCWHICRFYLLHAYDIASNIMPPVTVSDWSNHGDSDVTWNKEVILAARWNLKGALHAGTKSSSSSQCQLSTDARETL